MKQYDIGLDLGTTSIIIATQEQGVVFHQPSIGAVDTRSSTILAVGDKALRMVGRVPSYIDIIRPLRDGIIQDHRMTNELIVRFINEVCRSRIIKPRVSVCVPAAITGIEADAVVEAVMAAGARQVFLVDEPVAAALGAGLDIRKPMGCMVIDIGGGSTDIAVISMGGRVRAASLPVAGNAFDQCIAQYVQEKFNIAIGPLTAEALKKQVACCTKSEFEGVMEIRGHSWETNHLKVKVLGTKFNVHAYAEDEKTTTTLESGSVVVQKANNEDIITLTPNEQLEYDNPSGEFNKKIIDASVYSGWTRGELNFAAMTLSDIFITIERIYDIHIIVPPHLATTDV